MDIDTAVEGSDYENGSAALPDEVKDVYEGDNAIDQAVEALQIKREAQSRQRPRAEDEDESDPNVTKVVWKDPAKADKPLSARDAAKEYSHYRQELANQILEGAQSDWDQAAAQEAAQAVRPEQTEQTPESAEAQWQAYVEGLTPEGRAQLSAAVEYQQKAQQTEQAGQVYEMALVDLIGRLTGSGTWNDIQTVEDAERLRTTNPARFAQLQQHVQTVQQVQAEALRVNQQRQAQQQARYEEGYRTYATQEDRKAETLIPELRANADPESQRRLMQGAIDTLRAAGFTDAELHRAWARGEPLYLRDARAQKILASATRWELANSQAAKNDLRSKRVHAPPPQKPGASGGDHASFQTERALSERLQKTNSIHDAVKLLQARRASGRR